MSTKRQSEELTTVTGGFGYLQTVNFGDLLTGELDGLNVSFDRVKIPSGGGIAFELPGEDEETPDSAKEFTGVILFHHQIRGYYKTEYTGGNNPPDCGSMDGHVGVGDPGGNCLECPLAEFGTALNGKGGKACREHRRLYVLQEGEMFPVLYSIPAGSLKAFSAYVVRLLSKCLKTHEVVTRFSLKKAKSGSGMEYSEAVFSKVRALSPEEKAGLLKYAEDVRGLAAKVSLQSENTGAAPDAGNPVDEEDPF